MAFWEPCHSDTEIVAMFFSDQPDQVDSVFEASGGLLPAEGAFWMFERGLLLV